MFAGVAVGVAVGRGITLVTVGVTDGRGVAVEVGDATTPGDGLTVMGPVEGSTVKIDSTVLVAGAAPLSPPHPEETVANNSDASVSHLYFNDYRFPET